MEKRITIVGAGNVGANAAMALSGMAIADISLIDIYGDAAAGKALDISESTSLRGSGVRVSGGGKYSAMKGSDMVIVTAGFPRQDGMSRDDLLLKNAQIVAGIADQIKRFAPKAIVIVVTNPLDAMVELVYRRTGFLAKKVMGQSGVLDSARYRYFIAQALDVSVEDVHGMVLGGHGDSMVPLAEYTNVAGIPVTSLLGRDVLSSIAQRTRRGGEEVISLLGKGSAYFAPAMAIATMARSILMDERRVLPVCARLNGEFGHKGVYAGVPCVLGRNGVERVLPIRLGSGAKLLERSIDSLRNNISILKKKGFF